MRFLDANIFVYAYYKPRRELSQKAREMKEGAKDILMRINEGKEMVVTTVVHLSEMSNILKRGMTLSDLTEVILGLFMMENVVVKSVSRDLYFSATELGRDLELGPNDALAVEVMRKNEIKEIYSFDTDFDNIQGIIRLPRLSNPRINN